ncbi:COP9 signalosome complex subunit 6-like protein [Dinothrombium tinctorium]|uniref:COP9 signalosome complex subunit 6 n=1 Tax=Dinothrombium tinctorium TaxID=1965070 RepID=A0A3S3QXL7_9ACAR|nr:COP9 signalosome complex subunit 6-like protein [Dinothrombium tinctorium]RWS15571.1 COP9 signalosome complex subunit 6-like protein [Dinothrombium tinctorium]
MANETLEVGSVLVSLHPLVIMNVSEHWTRIKAQEGSPQQVIGALIGKQKGRNIEIMNSFELVFERMNDDIIVDRQYYLQKESQFKQVFPDLDFLGWYTTGETQPKESDIKIHRQICEINESPVLLKLNPIARSTRLPISMYESVIDLVNGEAMVILVELSYTLITEEAERIGLDHCARLTSTQQEGNSSNSVVAEQLRCQYNAVKMLRDRVKLILDYVKDTQSGLVPWDHQILREAYNLCHQLPVINTNQFSQEFYNQCNDVALMTYLGMLTKGSNSMNQFVNKFNVLYDRQGMGRRMRGLFF